MMSQVNVTAKTKLDTKPKTLKFPKNYNKTWNDSRMEKYVGKIFLEKNTSFLMS